MISLCEVDNVKNIVNLLIERKQMIATMESCTGGGVADIITNIEGSSAVFRFGAVTYSNEYKIKMGVPEEVINTYTVYSRETAEAMAKAICQFTMSDYGIGVTGKLNCYDPNNLFGSDNMVYFSIYSLDKNKFYTGEILVTRENRKQNKELIKDAVIALLHEVI